MFYRYVFGEFDITTGSIVEKFTIETPDTLTEKQIHEYIGEVGGVLIRRDTFKRKYSLPVVNFIKACEAYAKSIER